MRQHRPLLSLVLLFLGYGLASPSASEAAAVIQNFGVEISETKLDAIALSLGTKVIKSPSKTDFLRIVAQSDFVYINTHAYGARFPWHIPDQIMGRRGALVVGDSARFGYNGNDLVYTSDVRDAYRNSSIRTKLVVLVGCSGASFGWTDAFNAQTVIAFKTAIIGRAGDIYFSHFFAAWTKGGTVEEALATADISVPEDPEVTSTMEVKNGMQALTNPSIRVVSGNKKLTYHTVPPAGYPATISLTEHLCAGADTSNGRRSVVWRFLEQILPDDRGGWFSEGYVEYMGTWTDGRSAEMRLQIRHSGDEDHWSLNVGYFMPRQPYEQYSCTPKAGAHQCESPGWSNCDGWQVGMVTPFMFQW